MSGEMLQTQALQTAAWASRIVSAARLGPRFAAALYTGPRRPDRDPPR
jgi:hypothetical protein